MFRKNLHRRLTAIVFAAALALVGGAQPAAAEGFGWREAWDWLSKLWGGVTFLQPSTAADGATGEGDPGSGGPATNGDCGLEIDPNGCPRPTGGAGSGG